MTEKNLVDTSSGDEAIVAENLADPVYSAAYNAMAAGDRRTAARCLASHGTSPDDPIDVERALSWDRAGPITGGLLVSLWVYLAVTVL
jgi:hypothetical protein